MSKENLTTEVLEAQFKSLKDELEKNYSEKLATEVKALEERMKASLPVVERNISIPEFKNFNDKNSLNTEFKSFLREVPSQIFKTGVSISIPQQFVSEIVPTVGNWGLRKYCNYVGRLDSTVLNITRSVSDGTAYYMSTTGGGTASTVSAQNIAVNMDCLVAKIPIYDYQLNTKGYDTLGYVNKEISKQHPFAEDVQIMTGSGSPFTGLYNVAGVNVVQSGVATAGIAAQLTISALRAMVATIDPQFRTPDLAFYTDMTEEQLILGVTDANNRTLDITNGVSKILGYEVRPMSSGVLNGSSVSTTGSNHFILANLKEAIDIADQDYRVETIRTDFGLTNYFFSNFQAIGVRQPKAACIFRLHA